MNATFEEQAELAYSDGVCPDGAYIDSAIVDQWWRITVACDHGKWSGDSNGPIDLGNGLARANEKAKQAHVGIGPCSALSPASRACAFSEGHYGLHMIWAAEGGSPIEQWETVA